MTPLMDGIDRLEAMFDDESLVADAGPLLATLALRLRWEELVDSLVRRTGRSRRRRAGVARC